MYLLKQHNYYSQIYSSSLKIDNGYIFSVPQKGIYSYNEKTKSIINKKIFSENERKYIPISVQFSDGDGGYILFLIEKEIIIFS